MIRYRRPIAFVLILAWFAALIAAGCRGAPIQPLAVPLPSVRVLAKLDEGANPKAIAAAIDVRGGSLAAAIGPGTDPPAAAVVPELTRIGWVVVDAGGVDPDALASGLATVRGVAGAEVEGRRALVEPVFGVEAAPRFPLDPGVGAQWAHAKLGSSAAWDAGLLGAGVTVAIIDTGVDCGHPDLKCSGAGKDFTGSGSTMDGYGHGTHVAGTAAAIGGNGVGGSGIAPRAAILPVRVLDAGGSGADAWVAAGIVYAADAGAQVLNLSLGGDAPASILDDALTYATGKGALIACAAGNDGTNRPSYPNTYAGCIGVAATRKDGEAGATWTNWGPNADIGAPGENIMSTCLGAKSCSMSGTSMAAPAIAGTLALARGAGVPAADALSLVVRTGVALTGRLAGLARPDLAAMARAIAAAPTSTVPPPTRTATRIATTPAPGKSPTPTPFPDRDTPVPSGGLPWPCAVTTADPDGVTIRCSGGKP